MQPAVDFLAVSAGDHESGLLIVRPDSFCPSFDQDQERGVVVLSARTLRFLNAVQNRRIVTVNDIEGICDFLNMAKPEQLANTDVVVGNGIYKWNDFFVYYDIPGSFEKLWARFQKLNSEEKKHGLPCLMEIRTAKFSKEKYKAWTRLSQTILSQTIRFSAREGKNTEKIIPAINLKGFLSRGIAGEFFEENIFFVLGFFKLHSIYIGAQRVHFIKTTLVNPGQCKLLEEDDFVAGTWSEHRPR